MEDIQSWYEVPSIAHFCSLFRAAFSLVDFDIEELEEALLMDGAEDMGSSLIQDLIVRLLNGTLSTNDVTSSNYQMFLRRLFRQKFSDKEKQKNPFNSDVDFRFLPLRTKVEILHFLCDCRLEAEDVMEVLKNLEADSLRVEPLGYDDSRAAYWYFYGTRLYKEENALPLEEEETDKSKKKGKKRSSKDGASNRGPWMVACFSEEDWRQLCKSLANASSKNEKTLYRTLKEDFLPEIPNLFAEKERQQRKRLSEMAPRRASTRIEKLKQQKEEQERIVAVAIQSELHSVEAEANDDEDIDQGDEEKPKKPLPEPMAKPKPKKSIDEDEWLMLRNKADRATRALLREISRDNVDLFSSFDSTRSRTGSADSTVIDHKNTEKVKEPDSSPEKPVKKDIADRSEKVHKSEKNDRLTTGKSTKHKHETENKPMKRHDNKSADKERSEGKSNRGSTSSAAEIPVPKSSSSSSNKKGRQTNNSLSTVIETNAGQKENGVRYRRVSPSLSATTDEAKIGMYKILEQIKNHPDAWPFLDPVDEDFAPDYYTKISQPMDLEKMEQRVSSKYYQSINEFMTDFDLIVDNCKKYNGLESEYSFMVDSLSDEFRILASRYLNSVYEREPLMSGSDDSDCSSASDESSHQKRKPGVPDAKKRGGLMKLAQSLSGGNRSGQHKSTSTAAAAAATAAANKVKLKTEDVWDTPSPDSSETEVKNRKNSKSKEKADKKKGKNKKPPLGGRNLDALNALAAATEQTLKDMNKWLDDTPKFSEYSSGNSSPVNAKEFESISERVEEEYRKQGRSKQEQSPTKSPKKHKSSQHKKKGLLILAGKGRLPTETKEDRDLKLKRKKKLKKEKLMDSLFETLSEKADKEQPQPVVESSGSGGKNNGGNGAAKEKEKSNRKTLERLQSGGKSKLSKVSRPDESKLSSVIAKIKESRSSALQKQTETIQRAQLSLGTVLFGGEIGSNKTAPTEKESTVDDKKKEAIETESDAKVTTVEEKKTAEEKKDAESDDEPVVPEKPVVVEAKHSATPNLSAWFKAFGAPKNPIKRQMSETQETVKTQAPPFKKGIGQQQQQQNHEAAHSSKADLPWYARLDKKDSVGGRGEPSSSSAKEPPVATPVPDDNIEEPSVIRSNLMDPSSPADSMGSLNSPASAESIKSPSTPGGGSWGGSRYSAADNPPVRSPLTPETQSFSPSVVPHPIKVGFYQDMQALKGASPSHVKSPSCHSNSSGTGPNSPNDHALQNEPVRAPIPSHLEQQQQQQHHHHIHQQQQQQQQQQQLHQLHQHQQHMQQQRVFHLEASSSQGLAAEEKHVESYPLKKRSTPAMSHSPSPIVTPTPIHAARPTGPPMHHDNRINTPQPQPPPSYGGFNPADYPSGGVVRSARNTPGPVPQQQPQQQQQQHHHQPPIHPELQLSQYSQYSSYGPPQNSAPNTLPGNLASLSQIVARIPAATAAAAAAAASQQPHAASPVDMQHHHLSQLQHQQHQQQQHQLQQQAQQQQPKRNQHSNHHHQQPPQQQAFNSLAAAVGPTNIGGGYSYPPQPLSITPSSTVPTERTSSLVSSSPSFPGSHKAPSSSAPTPTSSSRTSNPQDHMMDYANNPAAAAAAAYSSQPGVFYPQATPAYRPQQTQQQHQTTQNHQQQQHHHQQQQQQPQAPPQQQSQQQPQQQQQPNRPTPSGGQQVFGTGGGPLNSFDPNSHSFMWNSRPEQVSAGHTSSVAPSPNAYGRPPSGSNPFPSSLSYEHHHHMSGSLLFSGLDPLAGNASMFGRNPLSRSSPWAPPLGLEANTTPAPISSRSQPLQQQQQQQPPPATTAASTTTSKATTTRKKNAAARAEAAAAAARAEAAAAAAAAATAVPTPGSAFNYNVSASSGGAGASDALSASLYDRHRGASQAPPPAHQGSSAISAHHHQYAAAAAAASGNHHFPPGAGVTAAGLGGMAPAFGDYQHPPHHPLAEHAQSSALYQQLLQRQQEELMLRNPHHPGMMLHQPGLLGSPAAYPPSFSSGLGLQPGFQPGWL